MWSLIKTFTILYWEIWSQTTFQWQHGHDVHRQHLSLPVTLNTQITMHSDNCWIGFSIKLIFFLLCQVNFDNFNDRESFLIFQFILFLSCEDCFPLIYWFVCTMNNCSIIHQMGKNCIEKGWKRKNIKNWLFHVYITS